MGRYTNSTAVINNWLPAIDLSALPSTFRTNLATQLDQVYIPMAEDQLDFLFGQTLAEETLTDVAMDGSGDWFITLPHFPIKTVRACRVCFGFERTIYNFRNIKHLASQLLNLPQDYTPPTSTLGNPPNELPDMFVNRDSGVVHIDLTGSLLSLAAMPGSFPVWQVNFPGGPRDVKVTYTHGFAPGSIPIDVQNAAGMWAAAFIADMAHTRLTGGAQSVKIGSVSKSFSAQGIAFPAMNAAWQKHIESTIRRWSQKPLGN